MTTLVLFGNTQNAALRHEIPVGIVDTLMWMQANGRTVVLTTHLEQARIAAALPDAEILNFFDLGLRELRERGLTNDEAEREVAVRVLERLGPEQVTVPGTFPVALADQLRAAGIELVIDDEAVAVRRRAKGERELAGIRRAQRAAEAGMAAAEALLARAEPGADGTLFLDGEQLHAEHVRAALRAACAEHGAACPPDVMVASVWNGFGHEPGSGPLPAGLPIQVDLWPLDEASSYWADMTRTFVIGDPAPEHRELLGEQEQLVRAAHEEALGAVRPGASGRELYDLVCDRFEAAGYATQRTGPGENVGEGFQFGLGHGVGLEVHEAPTLGLSGAERLVPGDVLAVEPGLWDRRIGGVRVEDLVLVTDNGSERITRYPYELSPRA